MSNRLGIFKPARELTKSPLRKLLKFSQWGITFLVLGWAAQSLHWNDLIISAPASIEKPNQTLNITPEVSLGLRSILLRANPLWALAALLCGTTCTAVLILRWRILWAHLPSLAPWHAFTSAWIKGQTIAILPTSEIGSDLYRIWWGSSWLGSTPPLLGLLLIERVIGLIALLVIAGAGVLFANLVLGRHILLFPGREWSFMLLFVVFLIAIGYAVFKLECFKSLIRIQLIQNSWTLSGSPFSFLRALTIVLLSIAAHLLAIGVFVLADWSLGLHTPIWCYLVAIPLISLAKFVPCHIAGIGLVEGGLWIMLHPWAGRTTAETTAVSIIVRLVGLTWITLANIGLFAIPLLASSLRKRSSLPYTHDQTGALVQS